MAKKIMKKKKKKANNRKTRRKYPANNIDRYLPRRHEIAREGEKHGGVRVERYNDKTS